MFQFLKIPFAEAAVDMTAFGNVIDPIIVNIVYPLIGLLFGATVIIFVYGVLQLVIHGDEAEARKKGIMMITYGSFGIFIMVSAWGIIHLVSNTVKGL